MTEIKIKNEPILKPKKNNWHRHLKFWVKTLIIPVILLVIGYLINSSLQKQLQSLDKIKFSDELITEAFDTTNTARALARIELLPYLVSDSLFVNQLTTSVIDYLFEIANQAAIRGNDSLYRSISDVAKCFTGKNSRKLYDTLQIGKNTASAEKAIASEDSAIILLRANKPEEAKVKFEKAANTHSAFRSNAIIADTLKRKLEYNSKIKIDSNKVSDETVEFMTRKYNYKLIPSEVHKPLPHK